MIIESLHDKDFDFDDENPWDKIDDAIEIILDALEEEISSLLSVNEDKLEIHPSIASWVQFSPFTTSFKLTIKVSLVFLLKIISPSFILHKLPIHPSTQEQNQEQDSSPNKQDSWGTIFPEFTLWK